MIFEEINDPKSWEKYFKSILKYHFGQTDVFDIPDENEGDWGVECYTSCGKVFQCYYPTGHHTVTTLYESQRDKINRDLKKLTEKNVAVWRSIFDNQGILVKSWVLATPRYTNKYLSKYITDKTREVRLKSLPFIDKDFRVSVQTHEDYPLEMQALSSSFKKINVEVDEVSDSELASWIEENVGFLSDLTPKLEKLVGNDESQVNSQKVAISNFFLTYQNMLEVLQKDYPQIHLSVLDCVAARKNNLKRKIALTGIGKAPATILEDEIRELERDLEKVVPNVLGGTRSDLCYGIVAGWLIECPLRF